MRPVVLAMVIGILARPAGAAPRAGAVASEHPAAAAAGAEMLRAGGTVVDAAIAAAAAVCIVHASSCGLGGGGFALVHRADGGDFALDYREVAPASATPEHFEAGGKPEPALLRATGLAAAVRTRGGVLGEADLARYRPRWRQPLAGAFRGRRIVTFPPPGSGGVLLEVLGLLAHDDLPALGRGTPTALHLLAGVMAQGFADRARWYGDPAFTRVPVAALLAAPRLAALRGALSALRPTPQNTALVLDHGTAHVSVADAEGNAAAITTTINTGFGAGILVAGTGVILNNEMDDFALAPGVPNVYGLVGTAANALAPGKRPQSSMSPTVVLDGRRPELVVGGSGGPTIISGTLQVVLGVVAFGLPLGDAVEAPRVHDQAAPPVLAVDAGVEPSARGVLERLGHHVVVTPAIGAVSAS